MDEDSAHILAATKFLDLAVDPDSEWTQAETTGLDGALTAATKAAETAIAADSADKGKLVRNLKSLAGLVCKTAETIVATMAKKTTIDIQYLSSERSGLASNPMVLGLPA